MAWGARSNLGIDDLVSRVASDEANLTALALLPSRRFGPAEAAALAGALRANTKIAELHLGGRAMSAESAGLLAEALIERSGKATEATAAASPLRALSVGDASFGCAGAAALAPLLSHEGALCGELDLELRGIGPEGARALAGAVVEARRRSRREAAAKGGGGGGVVAPPAPAPPPPLFLQSLNLARNPSLGGGDPQACEALSAALFDGVVEGEGGEAAAAAVLTSLDLSGCALSSAGVAALVRQEQERTAAAAGPSSSSPSPSPSPSPLLSLRLERNAALCPLAAAALARALARGGAAEGAGGAEGEGGGGGGEEGGRLANLRHLSLRGCPRLGDAAAEALARALSLSLSDAAAASSPAPPVPSALRSLDLSGCGVGPAGAAHLAAALASEGGCRLEALKLSGRSGGGGGGEGEEENGEEEEAEAAADIPATTAAALGNEGALSLARALASSASCSLAELDLSSCGISSGEAAAALLKGRGGGAGRLRALTLAGNPLGDAGALAVAAALLLRRGKGGASGGGDWLEHLDLAACGIGLEGAAALAEALLTATTATTAATTAATGGGAEEEDGAAAEFAAPSLRTLVLGGNPATEADAFAERVVARLREARPELDVAWRSGDQHAAAAEGKK